MEYSNIHIGAVVGQLGVIHKMWLHGDISEKVYRTTTTYTLANYTGFSRYHLAAILRLAYQEGLVDYREVQHRPNVRKSVYTITREGYKFLEDLKESGEYRSSLQLILHNRALQSQRAYAKDYASGWGETLEQIMMRSLEKER